MIVVSTWTRPFVKSFVILLFIGTSIGSIYMMNLFGLETPFRIPNMLLLHKTIQLDAVTLLIMGVMYMIIPRFRNIEFTLKKFAYLSFLLIIVSMVLSSIQLLDANSSVISQALRLAGAIVFSTVIFSLLRVPPRVGRLADYYFAASTCILIVFNVVQLAGLQLEPLSMVYLWLLFPILTVFGIQYKTMPIFLGYVAPKKVFDKAAFIASLTSIMLFLSSLQSLAFISLLVSTVLFAHSIYVFNKGLTPTQLANVSRDEQTAEQMARYRSTSRHLRIAYPFLLTGIIAGILYAISAGQFAYYDLAIHLVTLGFVGTTIMMYLPLMLPPILGKYVQFVKFNKIPLVLLITAILMRVVGDIVYLYPSAIKPVLGMSGFVVLVAMFAYVSMIHRAMEAR